MSHPDKKSSCYQLASRPAHLVARGALLGRGFQIPAISVTLQLHTYCVCFFTQWKLDSHLPFPHPQQQGRGRASQAIRGPTPLNQLLPQSWAGDSDPRVSPLKQPEAHTWVPRVPQIPDTCATFPSVPCWQWGPWGKVSSAAATAETLQGKGIWKRAKDCPAGMGKQLQVLEFPYSSYRAASRHFLRHWVYGELPWCLWTSSVWGWEH